MSEIKEIRQSIVLDVPKSENISHFASCEEFRNSLTQKQINDIVDAWYRGAVEREGGVIDE